MCVYMKLSSSDKLRRPVYRSEYALLSSCGLTSALKHSKKHVDVLYKN